MKTTIVTAVLMMAVIAIIVVEATTVPALVWSGKKQLGLSKFSSLRSVLSESSTVAVFLHHQVSIVNCSSSPTNNNEIIQQIVTEHNTVITSTTSIR